MINSVFAANSNVLAFHCCPYLNYSGRGKLKTEQAAVIFAYNSVQWVRTMCSTKKEKKKAQPDIFLQISSRHQIPVSVTENSRRDALVDLVLENVQVVGGGYGDDVL